MAEAEVGDDVPAVLVPETEPGEDATNDDDLANLLRKRQHAKPNKATWVLVTLLVVMVGFIGGAFAVLMVRR